MIVRDTEAQKTGKVLIIDSDPEITRILEVNLAHANLEVVSAQNGAEALPRIHNDKSDIIILDPSLPDMEYDDICRHIKALPGDVPVILIGSKSKKRDITTKAEEITIRYVDKPFDPREVVALVQGYLMHKERTVNIDPLTGLPNRTQVNKEIARLIAEKSAFAVIYIAMHDFKVVNRAYGYAQGDRVIQLLADIVSEAVRLFGNTEDLAGHFSGDKFVVVSTPWKARTLCRRIIADYNTRIKALFTEEHLQTGHVALSSPYDSPEQTPIMSIHIAVVTNLKRTFRHHLEVTGYASEQIEYLKSSPESNCYFDLKINGFEPSLTIAPRDEVQANKEERGNLEITSEKESGTTYQVALPKKWQSWIIEVNTLQTAMDISRKEARDVIRNIQRLVASIVEPVPPALKDAYDRLGGKIQELAVLCNRALFLADDFNSQLETQQDRLLHQESGQLATSEAILTICRNMIGSMRVKNLFDLESGKRVVKYALAIAKELKISDTERQALYHAALLKDIPLAFSRPDVIEQRALTDRETAAAMKGHLNVVWKALATIPFLLPACNLLLYRVERYDGTSSSFGVKGNEIPLGSRILAVADAFDVMTSARSPQGKIAPEQALQKILEESGLYFDPHVVSALLMLWKRNELGTIPG